MPTREVLTPAQRAGFLVIPSDISPQDVEHHYTFLPEELSHIREKRRPHNRLGFAVQWAYLRYPGRPWEAGENPPEPVFAYIAEQVNVEVGALRNYAHSRERTRQEHLQEIIRTGGFQPFGAELQRELASWLLPVALSTDSGVKLVETLVRHMQARRIVLPALSALERLAWEARHKAQNQVTHALTTGLSAEHRARLDALLQIAPTGDRRQIPLTWVRQASGKTAALTILRFLERITFLTAIGIPAELSRAVHHNRLLCLAREGARYTPQFLARTHADRRYAILVAFVLETIAALTDQVLQMHDRMIQQMMRRGEQSHQNDFQRSGRAINDKLRLFARVGKALIAAREQSSDPFAAIETVLSWGEFEARIAETEVLAQPPEFDYLDHIEPHYQQIHRYAPTTLTTFTFAGTEAMRPLLSALDVVRRLNSNEIRRVPTDAPTRFIKPRWEGHVFTDKGIDRRYYELCALTELRAGLRSGDVFVSGSRQFRDFEGHLLPWDAAREIIASLPVVQDVNAYLVQRRERLHASLTRVDERLACGALEGVRLQSSEARTRVPKASQRVVVSQLSSQVPPHADAQTRRAYDALPPIKITELLVDVDRWTGFTRHFTALRQGTPPRDREALFAAILADATNLGPVKMAMATPGMSYGRIAQVSDWHIRDETYAHALAELANAQHQQELATQWGTGTTSSSDGQHFPAGGRRENSAQANAHYGTGPGVMFYTHISDRYAPFHTKVISAGVRDATHVLDGLLYHESDIEIDEHYTDTSGYTEHVFALCHLLGFRFAPRMRDLAEKKLFLMGSSEAYPHLASLMGGAIREKQIRENWAEVLRLAASIQRGTVTASLMLSRLAAYPRQNNLAWALREIGRIERTLFTLEWFENPQLRHRATVGLNKGEQRNYLARAVYFYRRGMVQERRFEEMMLRASGLNLVVAAIILWNTVQLQKVISRLADQGAPIPDDCRPHLSPIVWDHILLTGEYQWKLATG